MPGYLDEAVDAIRRLSQAVSGAETPVVAVPKQWFSDPVRNAGPQKLVQRVLEATGLPRESFHSGAFVDPRSGQVLDGRPFSSGAMFVNPETGRPAFGVSDQMNKWAPVAGATVDANLIRRLLFKPMEQATDLPFLTTLESGGKHHYALGARYESPVLLRNTLTGENPTLRPRSTGSLWGDAQVGEISLRGKAHPVYSEILVAPRGQPRAGTLLRYAAPGPIVAAHTLLTDEEQY